MSTAYNITEGQLVRTFHERPEDAAFLTDRAACLALLGFTKWDTGGNCTALGLERADGEQLLITDADDNYPPSDNQSSVDVGFYDREGQQTDYRVYRAIDTEQLCCVVIAWLEKQYDATGGDAERSNGRKQS